MGSLCQLSEVAKFDQVQIGSFAQVPCFETQRLGPFGTLETAYTAIIRQQMRILAHYEVNDLPVDNYLAFLWRLNALNELIAVSASRQGPFYLKHFDDKGDHIMIDEEYNITGLIDWEFASAEAKELAFSAPCMMWPVGKFYDGDNSLTEDEVRFATIFEQCGRVDLGEVVRGGRRWQRYVLFLGGGIPRDMAELEPLFQGLRKSFVGKDGTVISSYADWKMNALGDLQLGCSDLNPNLDDLVGSKQLINNSIGL